MLTRGVLLAFGAGLAFGLSALLGIVWAIPALVVASGAYVVHEWLWLRRQEREMKAEWERWMTMTNGRHLP